MEPSLTPPVRLKRVACYCALGYLLVCGAYIWGSDRLVAAVVGTDARRLSELQTVKGWVFVGVMSVAVFVLVWRAGLASWRSAQAHALHRLGQAQYEALFAHSPDGGFVLEDGVCVAANRAGCQMLGCSERELLGSAPWDFAPPLQPDGRPSLELARQRLSGLPAGEAQRAQWRFRRSNGSEFDAEVTMTGLPGPPLRVLVWVRDVTAARQARAAAAEAAARLRLMVEGAPHFFFYHQQSNGVFTYVSPTVKAITGRPAAAWIGQRNWFLTEGDGNEAAVAASRSNLAGEQAPNPLLREVRRPDGRVVLLEAYEYVVHRDDVAVGVQGIARDVTESARAERVQAAIYRISESASSARSPEELFPAIHAIVGELMPASNFYIALYDAVRGELSFPYFVDEHDQAPGPQPLGRGMTEYVLRTGMAVLGKPETIQSLLESGEVELIGAPSIDWLGVPLIIRDRTIGVLVVQTYTEGVRYGEEELEILQFVSRQVAAAIERTRAEQKLRDSERRFRTLAETTAAGVLIIRDGRIAYANPAASAISGYSIEEMVGASLNFAVHPDDRELVAARAKGRLAGDPVPSGYEIRTVTKGGEQRWVLVSSGVLELGDGPGLVATFFDITERRLAELALQASEQRLRDIVEHSTNLFYVHTPDHVLTYVSPQTRQFFDCEPEEALIRWTELVTENPINQPGIEATQRAIDTGQRQPIFELELIGRKGRRIWVEVNEAPVVRDGHTVAIVGALADITERKRAEEALRESEERYRRLVEHSPDALVVHSEGTFVYANPAAARLFGVAAADDLIGRPILACVHPDDRERVATRVRAVLERGEQAPLAEERLLRADGTPIHAEVMGLPMTFMGRPAVQVVARDITARRELEERLLHTQKMEAIGRLAGGVAHDFNNLLQALLSTVQVLRSSAGECDRLRGTVVELEAHIRRGASLARQLLLFSRREVSRREAVDLNSVIADATELLQRLVRENIRTRIALAPGPVVVEADRGQLEQVLVNLVVNASDAMPDGGTLRIATGGDGGRAWFEVSDTGIGVPDELTERIFEPFFTTKRAGHGTGLGLAVVHGIVQQHGGEIKLESRIGEGASFRISMPRCEREPEAGRRRVEEPPRAGDGERVLLVEDEAGAREGLRDVLELLGYQVTAVDCGEAAEALPAEPAYDILLTDLLLPGVHGGELACRLQDRWPDLRVLVMSGYTEDEAIHRGVREGNVRFLQKPFDMELLARELRQVVELGERDQDLAKR